MSDDKDAFERLVAAVLPGSYYMDPPDGGDVPIIEQLRRMAKDAERYRYLRRKVAIVGSQFRFMNLPSPTYVAPDAAVEFDHKLDAEMGNYPCSMVQTNGERNA